MAPFVLVHGAFAGGRSMCPLARLLAAAGQEVDTPTLTGLRERAHLATPDVGLETNLPFRDLTVRNGSRQGLWGYRGRA
jgi:hypothetical protein